MISDVEIKCVQSALNALGKREWTIWRDVAQGVTHFYYHENKSTEQPQEPIAVFKNHEWAWFLKEAFDAMPKLLEAAYRLKDLED